MPTGGASMLKGVSGSESKAGQGSVLWATEANFQMPDEGGANVPVTADLDAFVAEAHAVRDRSPMELIRIDSAKYSDRSFHSGTLAFTRCWGN